MFQMKGKDQRDQRSSGKQADNTERSKVTAQICVCVCVCVCHARLLASPVLLSGMISILCWPYR